jgi:hypothetical protein
MPIQHRAKRGLSPRPTARASLPPLPDAWAAWVAEHLLLSVPRDKILSTMLAAGIPRGVAAHGIDDALRSPVLTGAQHAADRAKRYELRARLERETARVASHATTIERRAKLSADEFFERYYASGTPVILTDTFETWPALAAWSPSYFRERWPEAQVRVTTGRDADPATHTHFGQPAAVMPMREFCDTALSAGTTNDIYLISNDFDGESGALRPLLKDVEDSHALLTDDRHSSCVLLWFGPRGTITPLHHDTNNVLLCQIFGHKRVLLFPRFETPLHGAASDSVYRPLDMVRPHTEAFPELSGALRKETVLVPGEALFIPVGCFHQLRAEDASITLGFSNFRRKNDFPWYEPGKVA